MRKQIETLNGEDAQIQRIQELEQHVTSLKELLLLSRTREKRLVHKLDDCGFKSFLCDDLEAAAAAGIDSTFLLNINDDEFNQEGTFWKNVIDRGGWLVGLLIFQSCSSFILSNNESLLNEHPALIYFLTALVGAGGNAGLGGRRV